MTKEELKAKLTELFPSATIEENAFINLNISSAEILTVCDELKKNPSLDFDFLICESCVDWKTHFTMVYHLRSRTHRHEMVLKAKIDNHDSPEIETVSQDRKSTRLNSSHRT